MLLLRITQLPAHQHNAHRHAEQIIQIGAKAALVKVIDVIDKLPVFIPEGSEILEVEVALNPGRALGR
ncbi:hypothetical protein D3C77_770040 [compost metagenome]